MRKTVAHHVEHSLPYCALNLVVRWLSLTATTELTGVTACSAEEKQCSTDANAQSTVDMLVSRRRSALISAL